MHTIHLEVDDTLWTRGKATGFSWRIIVDAGLHWAETDGRKATGRQYQGLDNVGGPPRAQTRTEERKREAEREKEARLERIKRQEGGAVAPHAQATGSVLTPDPNNELDF